MKKNYDRLRAQAISLLGQILSGAATPGELLAQSRLTPAEHGWVLEMVQGVLRVRGRLDLILGQLALKKKPTGWLKRALWVGAYSVLYQDRVAPEAVVSEMVSLVSQNEGKAPAAFANALLRKIAAHAAEFRDLPLDVSGSIAEQALWASLPEWWWKKWIETYGLDAAAQMATAALDRPRVYVHAHRDAVPSLIQAGFRLADPELPQALTPGDELLGKAVPEWPGFVQGHWIVQDLSSQRMVQKVLTCPGLAQHMRESVGWDVCASPGGKTVALSWALGSARISASDLEPRLSLLRDTLGRTHVKAEVFASTDGDQLVWDGSARDHGAALPGWIWLDAPCTSSGLIRRHPEVRWQLRTQDLTALAVRQSQLLERTLMLCASGGRVVYSVCSLFAQEGSELVSQVVRRAMAGDLNGIKSVQMEAQWTQRLDANADGFYAAVLRVDRSL